MSPYRAPPPIEPWVCPDPFPMTVCCDCGRWTTFMGGHTRCARCDYRHLMRRRQPTPEMVLFVTVSIACAVELAFVLLLGLLTR